MRVAAGVFLIIAALFDLFGAFAYLGGGAVMKYSGKLTQMAEENERRQGHEVTDEKKAEYAQFREESSKMKKVAGPLMGYGVFLLVVVGTSIAGAVTLFRRRSPRFIMVACGLAIGAEILSGVLVRVVMGMPIGFGKVFFSSFGLIGGVLGFLAARQIAAAASEPEPAPIAAPM
jgi:hypothetical protein